MTRFFFHFRQDGILQPDETGIEYPCTEDAYLAAMEAIPGMWGELLAQRQDPLACAFEIRDAAGALMFMVPFRERLDACRSGGGGSGLRQSVDKARETRAFARRVHDELHEEFMKTRRSLRQSAVLLATPVVTT